jgi:hypothetical protein
MKLGIIARADNTGLGYQTLELCKMLKPHKIIIIDSSDFRFSKQYFNRYSEFNYDVVDNTVSRYGYPNVSVEYFKSLINDVDILISCETFYSDELVDFAKKNNIKTILQYNYEYFPFFPKKHKIGVPSRPDVLLAPSSWNMEDVYNLYNKDLILEQLFPPTSSKTFELTKKNNLKNNNRILHIAGTSAHEDRNGTISVLEMLKHSRVNYELVIKSQSNLDFTIDDPRVTIEIGNVEDRHYMYDGFDAMILPRRYGGLCLPMNEALLSGIPVFMTDISPNNNILPKKWLAKSFKIKETEVSGIPVDVYNSDPADLANKIDSYMELKDKTAEKMRAFEIGKQFTPEVLKSKYEELFSKIMQ